MGGIRALVAAGLFALAAPAGAVCPESDMHYAPGFTGPFKTYGLATQFLDVVDAKKAVTGKTAKMCADCAVPMRGVQLTSKREFGGGYFQLPFDVGATFCAEATIDLSRTTAQGAFAHIEFDSPAVAVDESPLAYVFVAVQDILGVRTVWAEVSGVPAGTPLELEAGVLQVKLELEYAGGAVDVRALPEGAETATTIVDGAPFSFAGTGRLGAGAYDLGHGDRAAIGVAASGEIFTASFRDLLADLDEQAALAGGAAEDLANQLPNDARAKLEEGLAALDPALLAAVTALPESKLRAFALAQLGKAQAKLLAARDAIDAAAPNAATVAGAAAGKAAQGFQRVERALRNGSVAEAKVEASAPT